MKLRLEYDPEADAVYAYLSDQPYDHGTTLDDARRIDYDKDGNPRGIELLYVSQGIELADLPRADELEDALRPYAFPVLA